MDVVQLGNFPRVSEVVIVNIPYSLGRWGCGYGSRHVMGLHRERGLVGTDGQSNKSLTQLSLRKAIFLCSVLREFAAWCV